MFWCWARSSLVWDCTKKRIQYALQQLHWNDSMFSWKLAKVVSFSKSTHLRRRIADNTMISVLEAVRIKSAFWYCTSQSPWQWDQTSRLRSQPLISLCESQSLWESPQSKQKMCNPFLLQQCLHRSLKRHLHKFSFSCFTDRPNQKTSSSILFGLRQLFGETTQTPLSLK